VTGEVSPASPGIDVPPRQRERATYGSDRNRFISLAIALAVEALLVLLLLTLGWGIAGDGGDGVDVVTIEARDFAGPEEAQSEPEAEQPAAETPQSPAQPAAEPTPILPEPLPLPLPPSPLELPAPVARPTPAPPPAPRPEPTRAPPQAPTAPARVYGPPDTGGPPQGFSGDSERVGTAPNGEPLYAARWYREPKPGELAGYLSTASGPGSALIACRTVPDFYVEDCVLLGETPQGSRIGSAVLGASWQFRVRPARIGGRSQVGSWVRIRIDYNRAR
jgi:protein TonB